MFKVSETNSTSNIQVVIIEGFDPQKNVVHTISKGGGRIAIPFYLINGAQRIPQVGETWIVRRFDSTNWFLEGRYSETDYSQYAAGDIIFDSPGTVHLNGDKTFINFSPFGPPELEEFAIDGTETQISLFSYPVSNSIQVFNNGLLVRPSSIIEEGKILKFSDSLSSGFLVVYYQREITE